MYHEKVYMNEKCIQYNLNNFCTKTDFITTLNFKKKQDVNKESHPNILRLP